MLSSRPPDSDSEEGQLEFSAKCRTFSTKCYTNNTSFFPHSLYSYSESQQPSKDKEPLQRNSTLTMWTTQGHRWHHHFLSTREGFFFYIFSIHIKTSILEINTSLQVLHKHPKKTIYKSYIQLLHHFQHFQQSSLSQVWTSIAGKAVCQLQIIIIHLNTLSTTKCLYQILFCRSEKLMRNVQKNHCQAWSMAPLSWDHTITLKSAQKQSEE